MCPIVYTTVVIIIIIISIIIIVTTTIITIILLEARNLLFFKHWDYWDTHISFQKDFRSPLKSKVL